MKKLLNFRPFFIIAISMMVATAFATYVFIAQNLKLIIFGVLVGLSLIFAVLSAVFKRKFLVVFMAVFLFMAIPFVSVYAKTNKINKNLSLNSTTVELTGKISGNYKFTSSGNLEILIDNVTASTKEITKSIDGKVAIYTNPTSLDLTKFKSGACVKIKLFHLRRRNV